MALGKQTGEFSLAQTSWMYSPGPGNALTGQGNYEGRVSGDLPGTSVGTLTVVSEPGAQSGTWSWCGMLFLDSGDSLAVGGEGTWETAGTHTWRLRGFNTFSDGQSLAVEGEGDLASKSLTGKGFEWS